MNEADFLTWVLIGVVSFAGGAILISYILNKQQKEKFIHEKEDQVSQLQKKEDVSSTFGSSYPVGVSGGRSVSGSRSSFSPSQSTSNSSSSDGGLDLLTTALLVNALTNDNDSHSTGSTGVSSYESSKQEPAVTYTPTPVATSDDSWSGLTNRSNNNDRSSWSGIETSNDRSSWSNVSAPAVETSSSTPSYSSSSDSGSSGSSCSSSCGSSCGGGGD